MEGIGMADKKTPRRSSRRGPRPSGGTPDRKSTISVRISPELKEKLFAATEANDRSLSQEAEVRLERSVRDEKSIEDALELAYGREFAGIILMLARAMTDAGRHVALMEKPTMPGSAADWLNRPWAFEQAVRAASTILEAFRPPGPVEAPPNPAAGYRDPVVVETMGNPGPAYAHTALRAVLGRAATAELREWGARRREQLGELLAAKDERNRQG
jgi:TraY domain